MITSSALLLVIPVLGAFIGVGSILFLRWVIGSRGQAFDSILHTILQEADLKETLKDHFQTLDLEARMAPILDNRLDLLVIKFKEQIPMASLFLSKSITEKLKNLAKDEIVKILPDLKKDLAEETSTFDWDEFISSKIKSIDPKQVQKFMQPLVRRAVFFAALFGFIIGLLQLWLVTFS